MMNCATRDTARVVDEKMKKMRVACYMFDERI